VNVCALPYVSRQLFSLCEVKDPEVHYFNLAFLRLSELFYSRYSGTKIVNSSSVFDIPASYSEESIRI
jgi:hypothetical protein